MDLDFTEIPAQVFNAWLKEPADIVKDVRGRGKVNQNLFLLFSLSRALHIMLTIKYAQGNDSEFFIFLNSVVSLLMIPPLKNTSTSHPHHCHGVRLLVLSLAGHHRF